MSARSKIEWTHHTFNPWWGCTKVSPACKHCYAEAFAKRVGQRVWDQASIVDSSAMCTGLSPSSGTKRGNRTTAGGYPIKRVEMAIKRNPIR